jgi:hypothetical protein
MMYKLITHKKGLSLVYHLVWKDRPNYGSRQNLQYYLKKNLGLPWACNRSSGFLIDF